MICEVKEFVTSSFDRSLSSASYVTMSPRDQHGTVRNKIAKAAKRQLRPYADRGEALVVVLANPQDIYVDIYEPGSVIEAMYGELAFSFDVDPETGQGGEGDWAYLDGGVFGGGLHSYVSAVSILQRRSYAADAQDRWMDENRYRWAGIEDRVRRMTAVLEACREPGFEEASRTPGEYYFTNTYSTWGVAAGTATPLPEGVFDGDRDGQWIANAATGCLEVAEMSHRKARSGT